VIPCACMVWQIKKVKQHSAGAIEMVDRAQQRGCGKKAVAFYRVHYSQPIRRNLVVEGDTFGVCIEHKDEFANLSRWEMQPSHPKVPSWRSPPHPAVMHQRGLVDFVEVVSSLGEDPSRIRMRDHFKKQLRRFMGQSNAQDMSPDDWRVIMEDAIDEHTVQTVLES